MKFIYIVNVFDWIFGIAAGERVQLSPEIQEGIRGKRQIRKERCRSNLKSKYIA
jgi:hypothetical protein